MYSRSSPRPSRWHMVAARMAAVLAASIPLLWFSASAVFAANTPPVQIYYVPVPEAQVLESLQTLYPDAVTCGHAPPPGVDNPSPVQPINTYISISIISDGTIIYYDQWEDGFEVDLSKPTQSTTQIWGDGDAANGSPPGVPADLLSAATIIVLESQVNPANGQTIDFDGGDKFGATRTIAVTRAAWATGPATRLAGALEVFSVDKWGTSFVTPVGQDATFNDSNNNDLFEYTGVAVMATDDATSVTVDPDGAGPTVPVSGVINEGESFFVNGGLSVGATVLAQKPVQVTMITGDVCENYESRWYVLFGRNQWSDSYYNPVSTPVQGANSNALNRLTTVFLYNPAATGALSVQFMTQAGLQTPISVPAQGVVDVVMPASSGAHFYTTNGSPFAAITAIDTATDLNKDSDWGFTLIPETQLTRQALVGWGAGRDPNSSDHPNENGSPVWITPVIPNGSNGPIQVCVDFDGDNSTGQQDPNGFFYDTVLSLNELENAQVYDPDGDQTGMLLYVCDLGSGQVPEAMFAAAWGQAPGIASDAQPGLDLGTAVPPALPFAAGKAADLLVDNNGDGLVGPGDTLLYTVLIQNSSRVTVENVNLSDNVPLFTSYVLSTTTLDKGTGTSPIPSPIPDDTTGTPFPLDEGGILLGDMPVRAVFVVTFQVVIDDPFVSPLNRVRNVAEVASGDDKTTAEVETPIKLTGRIDIEKTASDVTIAANTVVTYTYVVRNTGPLVLSAVEVVDDKCSPLTFVGGDSGGDGVLGLGEVWTYTCSATIVESTLNTAVVTALDPDGATVTDTDTVFVEVINVYLPIIIVPPEPRPCPPPDGCPLEGRVKGLAVHEGKDLLYVTAREPDQLIVFDPAAGEIVTKTATGSQPWGVAVNEQTDRVYVSNFASGDVWIYDADTLSVLAKIPVEVSLGTAALPAGANPGMMAILPDLDTVFVTVRGRSRIAIIKGLTLVQEISSGGSGPFGIAADPVHNYVYVSHRDSISFSLLRQVGGAWQAQTGPQLEDRTLFGIAYSGANNNLYSVMANPDEIWKIEIWEPRATDLWGRVTAVDVPSGGAVASPEVGGAGIVWNPATGGVFNANTDADNVSKMDGATYAILNTIPVLDDPFGAAVDGSRSIVYVGLRAPGRVVAIEDE